MSDKSAIEWTRGDDGAPGATWNPVTGCTKVSAGCDHCYAETFAERWRGIPGHHFEQGFDVTLRPERLGQPLRWRHPRRIFVNSMSDLFHEAVPDEHIARVFAVMAATPRHTYQLLTKRHGRMRALLSRPGFWHAVTSHGREHYAGSQEGWLQAGAMLGGEPLPNVHLGVSAEDQKWADIRIPALLQTPAAVRFVSAEPLLGPLSLHPGEWIPPLGGGPRVNLARPWVTPGPVLDWVICGGESGRGARPMDIAWARSIVAQCQEAGVPAFVKQLGSVLGKELGAGPKGGDWDRWPEDIRVREFPRVVTRAA